MEQAASKVRIAAEVAAMMENGVHVNPLLRAIFDGGGRGRAEGDAAAREGREG